MRTRLQKFFGGPTQCTTQCAAPAVLTWTLARSGICANPLARAVPETGIPCGFLILADTLTDQSTFGLVCSGLCAALYGGWP